MNEINIIALSNQLDYCPSLPEFADIYADARFYYVKNGERFYISAQDAFLFLCNEKDAF